MKKYIGFFLLIIGTLVSNRVIAVCNYPYQNEPTLISRALGNVEQCVTFPYLEPYSQTTLTNNPTLPYFHAGIDLRASYIPAYSIVSGIVTVACGRTNASAACTDSFGVIMISTTYNGEQVKVLYLHMSESSVRVGDAVQVGSRIGTTGRRADGNPTGVANAHLHIEVRKNYNGTTGVGLPSCSGNCTTSQKVAGITYNPALLVVEPLPTLVGTGLGLWVKAPPIYAGAKAGTSGGFDAQFTMKNNSTSTMTFEEVAMSIHATDPNSTLLRYMKQSIGLVLPAGQNYWTGFIAVDSPSMQGSYKVVARIKRNGVWINLAEKTFYVQPNPNTAYYHVLNGNSAKCMDTYYGNTADGTNAIQYTCTNDSNMYWSFTQLSNSNYKIANKKSGTCLDVSGSSKSDWAKVVINSCNVLSSSQEWKAFSTNLSGYYSFQNVNSGKCLDVYYGSTANFETLIQYTCSSVANNMKWKLY